MRRFLPIGKDKLPKLLEVWAKVCQALQQAGVGPNKLVSSPEAST